MIGKIGNQISNSGEKFPNDSNLASKNIYSKIAPPNTFKKRNINQVVKKPRIYHRYEKTPQTNQMSNPQINYGSNFSKRASFISNSTYISNANSNIKLSQNINSSFREKIKIIKGNLFNNPVNIISPKKLIIGKLKVNISNNRSENFKIKVPTQFITKHKSVYVKKDKNNMINNFDNENLIKANEKNDIKNNENFGNIINSSIDSNEIKDKYDFLLERTRILLSNYQKIVEYYQEKEKEKNPINNNFYDN
jgi:hypothetical protein